MSKKPQKEDHGVSIVVPCYNAGAYIDECLQSVLAQNSQTLYEIILVDDGSTDLHTIERVKYWEAQQDKFPIQVIWHEKNKKLSEARNTAIRHARYPFILPLDADDKLVLPHEISDEIGYIDKGARILKAQPDLDVVSPQTYFFGNVEGPIRFPRYDAKRILYKCHIPVFSMIRKSAIEAVGGYSPAMTFAEDWDLWVAITNHHHKIGKTNGFARIDEPLVYYRTHKSGTNLSVTFKAVSTWPVKQMIQRSPEVYASTFPHIPQAVLPEYLLTLKLGYLGKLGLKAAWSDNAHTYFENKAEAAKTLLKRLF